MVHLLGSQAQLDHDSLTSVFFHTVDDCGQFIGKMNTSLNTMSGVGILFDLEGQITISNFDNNEPSGHTLTILKNKEYRYSFYDSDGYEEVWH